MTPNACGMACGRRLLGRQGIDVFQSNLSRGFYRGLEPQTLAANLNRYQPGWIGGYGDLLSEQQLAGLASRGPFIARIGGNPGHFVVVDAIENGVAKLWDPAGGGGTIPSVEGFCQRCHRRRLQVRCKGEVRMGVNRVVVKYYSRRMLITVDIPTLLDALFDAYGDDVSVEFVAMSESERRESTDAAGAVPAVRDRFQVFDIQQASGPRRRSDLERVAIAAGAK